MLSKVQQHDLKECEIMMEAGEEKDCSLCSCNGCLADMITGMSFEKYQLAAERTAGSLNDRNRFLNFSMGLTGEAGEVVDYLKKVLWHGHEMDQDKLKKELGDVLWYVATIATTADLDLSEIAIANIEKLKKRYPEGFDEEKSIKRTE